MKICMLTSLESAVVTDYPDCKQNFRRTHQANKQKNMHVFQQ